MDVPIWEALTDASTAIDLIVQLEKLSLFPAESLQQLKITLSKAKDCLTGYLQTKPNDNAFDVCFGNIKRNIKEMLEQIEEIDAQTSMDFHLMRNDLLLSYRVDQLLQLFPDTKTNHDASSIIKDKNGAGLWKTSFGSKIIMVPSQNFYNVLASFLSVPVSVDSSRVLNFIDFTRNGFVTPYEFNLFLRWFGPLPGSVKRILYLLDNGILAGFISAEEASSVLLGKCPGTFLLRFSKSEITSFALAYVNSKNEIRHCLLNTKSPYGIILGSNIFSNLEEFIEKNQDKVKKGAGFCWLGAVEDKIKAEENNQKVDSIFVPEPEIEDKKTEQKLCVVCMDNPQEVIFLECGHLCCCKVCSEQLHRECPICRQYITRIIPVFQS